VLPPSAARPGSLPWPGRSMPGPPMLSQPVFPGAAFAPPQPSPAPPSYISGAAFSDRPVQMPYPGVDLAPAIDRDRAIQQAASAIQRGADVGAVRARLTQMGIGEHDIAPRDHFSDLVPAAVTEGAGDAGWRMQPQIKPDLFTPLNDPANEMSSRSKGATLSPKYSGSDKVFPPVSQHHFRLVNGPGFGGPPVPPSPRRTLPVTVHNLPGGINGYGYLPQPGDAQLLARAIYSESANTPGDMRAIGWSIVNRIGFRRGRQAPFGTTLSQVIYQPGQYSFLNGGGSQGWRESADPSRMRPQSRRAWAQAVATANAILSHRAADPTSGAQYFFASPDYVPGNADTAPHGFPDLIRERHISPAPYQSTSTLRENGHIRRNYFFIENPAKLWPPQQP